jgi:hypothetical protein
MDYAAVVPSRTRFERPATPDWLATSASHGIRGCNFSGDGEFWSTANGAFRFENDLKNLPATGILEPKGVINRSSFCQPCAAGKQIMPWANRISFDDIEDGSSNTLVIGEKRMEPSLYTGGAWYDDRGWTDGWDPDTLRSTFCQPGPDQDTTGMVGASSLPYAFGGRHTGAFMGGFADASVRPIRFDIDIEVLNYLGHRSDGQTIDQSTL